MKDLIQKVLAYLPRYFMDFGSLLSGPKVFMAHKNTNVDETYSESLTFLGVSIVLVVIMKASQVPPDDLWNFVGGVSVTVLLGVALSAVALRLAWRIVGGQASVRSFFVTYSFFFGVVVVVLTVFELLGVGVFKVFDHDLYVAVTKATLEKAPPPQSDSMVPFASFLVLVVGYIVISIWSFIAWGAYRELNGLGKLRSFLAAMVMGVLSVGVTVVVFFVATAITKT